jgi:hypothetical protein
LQILKTFYKRDTQQTHLIVVQKPSFFSPHNIINFTCKVMRTYLGSFLVLISSPLCAGAAAKKEDKDPPTIRLLQGNSAAVLCTDHGNATYTERFFQISLQAPSGADTMASFGEMLKTVYNKLT